MKSRLSRRIALAIFLGLAAVAALGCGSSGPPTIPIVSTVSTNHNSSIIRHAAKAGASAAASHAEIIRQLSRTFKIQTRSGVTDSFTLPSGTGCSIDNVGPAGAASDTTLISPDGKVGVTVNYFIQPKVDGNTTLAECLKATKSALGW